MKPLVYVVDDDESMRRALSFLLQTEKYEVRAFASAAAFLAEGPRAQAACVLSDIRMPEMDGLELQKNLARRMPALPVIIMTGHGDVPLAVRAMAAGAIDFLEKPFDNDRLLEAVARALKVGEHRNQDAALRRQAEQGVERLTPREREVFHLLAEGEVNKTIAVRLGISPRTVEVHRIRVMEKMKARTVADLVRAALSLKPPGDAAGREGT